MENIKISGKRKEERTRVSLSGTEGEKYMNTDGRGTRQRDQVVRCDLHSKDIDDSDDIRDTRNEKIKTDRITCKTIRCNKQNGKA